MQSLSVVFSEAADPQPFTTTTIGLFTRDPIGYQGSEWDLYEFCNSVPLHSSDPDGQVAIVLVPAAVVVVGGVVILVGTGGISLACWRSASRQVAACAEGGLWCEGIAGSQADSMFSRQCLGIGFPDEKSETKCYFRFWWPMIDDCISQTRACVRRAVSSCGLWRTTFRFPPVPKGVNCNDLCGSCDKPPFDNGPGNDPVSPAPPNDPVPQPADPSIAA